VAARIDRFEGISARGR